MLEGALPRDHEQRRQLVALTVDGIAVEVAGLSLAAQKEIGELFGLLVLAPARFMLAGVGKPWREKPASPRLANSCSPGEPAASACCRPPMGRCTT
jgi:hypothetical protein